MHRNPDHQYTSTTEPEQLAAWFPLVPRGRPAAQALPVRIDEVRQLATRAPGVAGQDRQARVVQALNKAALIASDCGLPDLAGELCWRQFTVLHAAAPLSGTIAQYALEPLINLGRLATRRGDGTAAYQLYQDIFDAVTTGATTRIDGRDVDFANLVHQPEDRQRLRRFLWAILLADGTRALVTVGRWNDVLTHLERYNGIGDRMLDGRQAAILAHACCGRPEQALAMLDATTTPEPWERAVTACLRTLCLHLNGRTSDDSVSAMLDAIKVLPLSPEAVVFHTRLGLCAAGLAQTTHPVAADEITTTLVRLAVRADDARAAVDLLTRRVRGPHRADYEEALTCIVETSGIRPGVMHSEFLNPLADAAECALTALTDLMGQTA